MYSSFPVSTYELVVSLGLCTLQSHVVPSRLRTTCNKASKFLLSPRKCRIFEVVLSFICMLLFGNTNLFLACIRITLYWLSIPYSQSLNYRLQKLMIVPSYMWHFQHKAPLVVRQPSTETYFYILREHRGVCF